VMGALYAGLDVSDKTTAVCIIDAEGKIVTEDSVETNPSAIASALAPYKRILYKVGHVSGSKGPWLHKELLKRRYSVVCLDARRVHGALSTRPNKTDRNDALGIAQVVRNGWYTPTYIKSDEAFRLRLVLTHRRALKRNAAAIELCLRGSMKVFGATLQKQGERVTVKQQRGRSDPLIVSLSKSMLRARDALRIEIKSLDVLVARLAANDPVCRRLMTVPGVGPITALTFRAAIDDPHRFASSRNVAAYFGLTPRRFQSGETDINGRISKMGDGSVRSALYEAAFVLLTHSKSPCRLRQWGSRMRRVKGVKKAVVAVARKLAVTMHRMWISERDFDPSPGPSAPE
jgi:transposase